ncbi:ArsR/SmtB family transcription factor [Cryptosporangium phraense]|uniref:Helix-turn-helix domain-containing protein n=1 Tax=Cryptosporangium phraense TaxID=2593070 RepID=A0A545AF18_9ACTN|nr:helix-turn-helix domain-containing protein [Cryptosporangium phraense]TQS39914.1 helix-turn-helix domain-containing protein [Cryptosporangium phraense]
MSSETPDRVAALRAAAHPLRLRILSLLTGAPMTATEVAQELGITHANASYHLRKLLILPAVVVEHEGGPGRGGSKRYRYDAEREPRTGGRNRPVEASRGVFLVLAEELSRRAGLLAPEGRGAQTDAELWVTPEDWDAVVDTVREASLLLHRAAKPPRSPGTVHVNATIALFPMVDRQPAQDR